MQESSSNNIERSLTKNHHDRVVQQKRVALIGSSGGGIATLGHNKTSDFIKLVSDHLNIIGDELNRVNLDTVLFVSLDNGAGFDSVSGEEKSTLLFIRDKGSKQTTYHDKLDRINEMVKEFEATTAVGFEEGNLHGLISVSCKPHLFSRTLQAVAKQKVPVTGTGGSSLALATTEFKLRLIGNSGGSVGTTPETKAISFASALSKEWNLEYNPWKLKFKKQPPPSCRSVLNSCLPGFWSIALFKRIILATSVGTGPLEGDRQRLIFMIESYALPTLCAVVMANSRRKVESVQMSAVISATACYKTVLGGLISGWLVAFFEERLLYMSIINWNFPATSTNLITGGFVGVFTAALMTPINPYLRALTEEFRNLSTSYLWDSKERNPHEYFPPIGSLVLALLFCLGSKLGWYHAIFLPMILIEMELGDASMLGVLDLLTLVLVSAGVCFGLVLTGSEEERSLAKRGLKINLLCGDFIEACYPHMERHRLVDLSSYLASFFSAAILTSSCRSSAYLPFPIAIWLADDRKTLLTASAIAFLIPFIATVINYLFCIRNKKMN